MRRWIYYFAGGVACLGVGATFYIFAADLFSTPKIEPANLISQVAVTNEPLPEVEPPAPPPATILFLGDMMLGRSAAVQIAKNDNDYPFEKTSEMIGSADYAIANLEGPLTKISNSPANRMVFHFDPALAKTLSAAGFDAVSLANNHGLDQGQKGSADTKKYLDAEVIGYFGDVSSDDGRIQRFAISDTRYAVIGLHDVYRQIDPAAVAKTIAEEKNTSDLVIVYPHWGEEYQHKQNARQIELAHAFIDAGADLVIGSHPHVIQGIEIYKDKPIFYSLGNFIFDQYFSVETQEGLAVRLATFGAGASKQAELLPYEIPLSQPAFVDGDKKVKMLQDIASWSDPALKDQIEAGQILLK